MTTRSEHLEWCKERANALTEKGDLQGAFASFLSDMKKHPDTEDHMALGMGMSLMMGGNLATQIQMKEWVNGFN